MINRSKIENEFKRIKSLGFVTSHRTSDTGIGKTFEDHLGVNENNVKNPDFDGFEVKTQRQITSSKITLFTKSPSNPSNANAVLKESFGTPDKTFPDIKVLHTSCFGDRFNNHKSGFGFKLFVNKRLNRVYFTAKDLSSNKVIDTNIYWTFDDLNECITKKLKALFVVFANSRKIKSMEEFHFTKAIVYYNLKFEKFISNLNAGHIQFDVRIGAYKTLGRANYGKPHDHGSGFRVGRNDIANLFEQKFDIE